MADNEVASISSTATDELSPGAHLKKVRLEKEKTLDDISKELHLDKWMLEALERDDYSALGAPVFAKGHLRQYAKLLGIEPDDLMVGYYQVCGSREQPPLVSDSMLQARGHHDRNWNWLVPVAIALVLISVVGGFIYWYLQPTEEPASVGSAPGGFASTNVVSEPSEATGAGAVVEQPAATQVERVVEQAPVGADSLLIPAEQAAPVEVVEEEPESGAGSIVSNNLTVTLRFTGNSWVEVYDAKRQKLLYGLVESAAVKYLNGPPPINVFLGRQNAVSVEVNGDPYSIPVTAMRGNTARFQIEKPQ